ncbi:PAS domain S-box protein [Candidatus Peregrinibacteria bacterium]|nr:PAS domain S-box protein [Candidatus Peregrinibacteria bacterium]
MAKLVQWFIEFTQPSKRRAQMVLSIIFVLLVAPLVVVSFVNYRYLKAQLTASVLKEHGMLASFGATMLDERFGGYIELGESVANRISVKEALDKSDWDGAILLMKDIVQEHGDLDRIFVTDTTGLLHAGYPAMPEVVGKNYAFRDWFRGVSRNWEPYVSEAYRRAIIPEINAITIAIPLRGNSSEIKGILALQLKMDTIQAWARNNPIGESGFLYFIDPSGHPIGHPLYAPQAELVDLRGDPAVIKALGSKKGSEIYLNAQKNQEVIVAYASSKYKWAAIVEENSADAFRAFNWTLLNTVAIGLFLIVLSAFFVIFILNALSIFNALRQRQESLLESIGDGVVAIDRYFNIILWNKASQNISGYAPHEALGRPFREIMQLKRESDHTENIVFLEETMLFGKTKTMENSTLLIAKDGREIPVSDSAAPVFDPDGKVVGAIVVFRDVTKEREVETARQEFVSLASHQLRTPLTGIRWITQILMKEKAGPLTDKQRGYILDIDEANGRLLKLVNSLLNSSRVELGTFSVTPEPTDLEELTQITLKELESEISKKELRVHTDLPHDIPVIEADPKLIKMILQNLISNAVKYTPSKGQITISLSKEADTISLKVSDTGMGIPKAEQGKVFSKLWRGANAEKSVEEGTGLGLYIIKSILDKTGGKIGFKSVENKGTTFLVSLPVSGMQAKKGEKTLS